MINMHLRSHLRHGKVKTNIFMFLKYKNYYVCITNFITMKVIGETLHIADFNFNSEKEKNYIKDFCKK